MTKDVITIDERKLGNIINSLLEIEKAISKLYYELVNLYVEEVEPTEEEKKIIEQREKEEEIPLEKILEELEKQKEIR